MVKADNVFTGHKIHITNTISSSEKVTDSNADGYHIPSFPELSWDYQ
jgi:hypothetical protein